MRQACRVVVYMFACVLLLVTGLKSAEASADGNQASLASIASTDFSRPDWGFSSSLGSGLGSSWTRFPPFNFIEYSPVYDDQLESLLLEAVTSRLGLPYRFQGTDDRGYDCSGFVWRVFREAGIYFERSPARHLWERLPRATEEEESLFGTLVFFRGLNHVGIVRDEDWFYHASSSKGIVRSRLDGYWGDRVIGYRRVFAPVKKRMAVRRR